MKCDRKAGEMEVDQAVCECGEGKWYLICRQPQSEQIISLWKANRIWRDLISWWPNLRLPIHRSSTTTDSCQIIHLKFNIYDNAIEQFINQHFFFFLFVDFPTKHFTILSLKLLRLHSSDIGLFLTLEWNRSRFMVCSMMDACMKFTEWNHEKGNWDVLLMFK